MAIITVITVAVLVAVLVRSFMIEEQKDPEAKECDFNSNSTGKESILNIPEPSLELGQSSRETHSQLDLPSEAQYELAQNLEELFVTGFPDLQMEVLTGSYPLVKTTAERQLPSLSFQVEPLQSLRAESETKTLKIGLKIACVVISVSTSGIVSFLVGFSGSNNQSSTRNNNKLLFKAVILSMCASLFSALILLIISTINLNVSWLVFTVRIITVISTALMTLGVIFVIAFYFHVA